MTDHRNNIHDPLDETAAAALDAGEETASVELAQLKRERDELKDRLLRTVAEFDNFRKRTDRDRQAAMESITAGVIEELLPARKGRKPTGAASSSS